LKIGGNLSPYHPFKISYPGEQNRKRIVAAKKEDIEKNKIK